MHPLRRRINQAALLLFAAGIFYFIFGFATAEARVKKLCLEIHSGMKLAQLQAFGHKHGLRLPQRENGTEWMVEKRTYGRYGCRVELEAGEVKHAYYEFAD